jgi:hypothetical protein
MKRCCLFAPGDIVLLKFILRYANTELYAMKNRVRVLVVSVGFCVPRSAIFTNFRHPNCVLLRNLQIEERAVDIAAAYHNFECYDILKEWGEDDNQNSWK